jgi:hypothetical protein
LLTQCTILLAELSFTSCAFASQHKQQSDPVECMHS